MTSERSSLLVHGHEVPVSICQGVDIEKFYQNIDSFKPFQNWAANLSADLRVVSLSIQSIDYFGPRIGFLKLNADVVSTIHNTKVPGIVFMRGDAVAVLVILRCEGQRYILLTEQARVPVGDAAFQEIPAGMMDDEGDITGVAMKEMVEETGIKLCRQELQELGDYAFSPGGCDEKIHLFFVERDISAKDLDALKGHLGGDGPHERIRLRIVSFSELLGHTTDAKTVLAFLLYQHKNATR